MPSLATVRLSNSRISPPTTPVAIFIGGTSGIGQATAQALARHLKGNVHLVLVGRNRAAAEAIFETLPKAPESKYEFVACDAGLLRNIPATTAALVARLPKANYVVLTCGTLLPFWDMLRGVQRMTEEGVGAHLELVYYARVKFMLDLLPLLQKARDIGEDARVLNVAAAGLGGPINFDDMGLRKTYGLRTAGEAWATYTDAAMEVLAARVSGATFTHAHPGGVDTPIFPWWFKPLAKLMCTPMEDGGEYMLYALLNGGEGLQRKDQHGDVCSPKTYHGGDEVRDRVWAHTMAVIDSAVGAGSAGNIGAVVV